MSDFFAPSYWYGAGPGAAFSSVNNAVANNQANMIPAMNANMAYVQGQEQMAMAAAQPTPYGYGFVTSLAPSFGEAAAPGTYSPGSGLSSFSGVSLGGGGGYPAATSYPEFGYGGGSQADPWNPYATQLAQPYSGGGIGSDAYLGGQGGYYGPRVPNLPVLSQDWQTTFNNTVNGDSANPYYLGDSSWYPSQRSQPAAPDYSAWYAGLPGGAQAYNSWNLGLPAQGGFGVPGAGGGMYSSQAEADAAAGFGRSLGYFNPGAYAGDQGNYGIPFNGRPMAGDIGFTPQTPMPNLGYNPGMANWFANPAMSGGDFQSRFGMGFPNAGTPSQYAPGAQMPPGFAGLYSVDNPSGALPAQGFRMDQQ